MTPQMALLSPIQSSVRTALQRLRGSRARSSVQKLSRAYITTRTQPPRTQPPRTQPPRTQPPRTQPPRIQPPCIQPPRIQPYYYHYSMDLPLNRLFCDRCRCPKFISKYPFNSNGLHFTTCIYCQYRQKERKEKKQAQ